MDCENCYVITGTRDSNLPTPTILAMSANAQSILEKATRNEKGWIYFAMAAANGIIRDDIHDIVFKQNITMVYKHIYIYIYTHLTS